MTRQSSRIAQLCRCGLPSQDMSAPTAAVLGSLVMSDMYGASHGTCGAAEAMAALEKARSGDAAAGVARGPRAPGRDQVRVGFGVGVRSGLGLGLGRRF